MDRKDLAVHSELVSDGVIPLIEAGVITGARKNFKPRKIIPGFCPGHQAPVRVRGQQSRFSSFIPRPTPIDPALIARNDKMVAINSALQIDLTGQVCSDSIGNQFYSGIGGQVDFLRGASRSKGGKPIIAISSTAKNGTMSRIVPMLDPGRRRGDLAWSRPLRGHRVRRGLPARQIDPGTSQVADRDCASRFPRRAVRILRKDQVVAESASSTNGGTR